MKLNEKELLKSDFEGFIRIMSEYKTQTDLNQLLETGLKYFTFSGREINRLDVEYYENPNEEIKAVSN